MALDYIQDLARVSVMEMSDTGTVCVCVCSWLLDTCYNHEQTLTELQQRLSLGTEYRWGMASEGFLLCYK